MSTTSPNKAQVEYLKRLEEKLRKSKFDFYAKELRNQFPEIFHENLYLWLR